MRIRGRDVDISPAREHRAHHAEPTDLDRALIPWDGVLIALAAIAGLLWLVSLPLCALVGGSQQGLALTMIFAGYALMGAFEWFHFLIHTSYRPRGRYFRAIWRNHRLHHFKN
jgi:hypothetical protein